MSSKQKSQAFFANLPKKVITELEQMRARAKEHARKPSNAEIVSRGIRSINREFDLVEEKESATAY